jgi:T-complex protein 1 subunit theta
LLKNGLHTAEVISGYQRAYDKTLELLPLLVCKKVENLTNPAELKVGIKSVIATKQYGYEDMLSDLVVQACLTTLPVNSKNPKLNLDSVRISKLKGGNLSQSSLVKGMVILRDTEGLIKKIEKAKIAVYACGFEASSTEAKGTVLIRSAEELLNYNKSEEKKMEEIVEGIVATGVRMVIVNGSISEIALHFLDKYNLMILKIQSKFELRRICGAVGATAAVRLGALTPEEIGECSR